MAYLAQRSQDARPVVEALFDRGLDLLVPVLMIGLFLPAGSALVRRGTASDARADEFLPATGIAVGCAMLSAIVLGILGVLGPWTLLVPGALTTTFGCREWRWLAPRGREFCRELVSSAASFPGVVVSLWVVAATVVSLTPAVSQDALHYHLAVPKAWLEAGTFSEIQGNIYSHFPMHTEMLFMTALAWRGEIAAKACHLLLAILAALAIRRLATQHGGRRAGDWSAAIFLSIPTVFRVATWAYVELGLVFFLVLSWHQLLRWRHDPVRTPRLAGLFVGLACGVKYTMLPVAAAFTVLVLVSAPRMHRLRSALVFVSLAVCAGGFWYGRNAWGTGNPFFPFLYDWFGGSGWDMARAEAYGRSLHEWGSVNWSLPLDVTFGARFASIVNFDGVVGPVFLIGAPLILMAAFHSADKRAVDTRLTLAAAILLSALWVMTTRQIRFLVPTLALLSALIPVGAEMLSATRWRSWVSLVLGLGVVASLSSHVLLICQEAPLAHAVGLESGESNRDRRLPGGDSELFRQLPELVGEHERILFAACGNPVYLCDRPHHADSVVENYTLRQILANSQDEAGFAREFRSRGFTHLLFRFDLVFDEQGIRSDLTIPEQRSLALVLNRYGQQIASVNGTFLYRIAEVQ